MIKTYSISERLLFAPNIVERVKPKIGEQRASSQHEEFTHPSTNVSDVEKGYENRVTNQIIRDKEVEIKKLEDNLTEANALIACLQQENM